MDLLIKSMEITNADSLEMDYSITKKKNGQRYKVHLVIESQEDESSTEEL